jgi:hypothetical protein
MNQLLKFTNPFVAKSVELEYKLAASKCDEFEFEGGKLRGVIIVQGKTKLHEIDVRTWFCTCSFTCTPCQRAIAYRKVQARESSIPLSAVGVRYIRRYS